MLQVPLVQIGNDIPGPKKHFEPQRAFIVRRSLVPGLNLLHPLVAEPLPFFLPAL
jgi:hypothetical protein